MKPFLLVTGDFVKTGGMDRCNHALANFLADRGHETHLVGYRADSDLLEHPNIKFHRVAKPMDSYFFARPMLRRRARAEARRIASRGGRVIVNGGNCVWPDVNWAIHLHARYQPQVASGLLRRIKAEFEFRSAVRSEQKAFAVARLIIAASEATRRELIDDFGILPERVHTVNLGVDPELFRIPTLAERASARAEIGLDQDTAGIVFIGALGDRRKGFDTVYATWKQLCDNPSWRGQLIVVGSGFELPAWKARARSDGLANRIRFLGFDTAMDFVARVLRACDVMVAPTRYEGYGLAIQEGICTGVPTIVSRIAPVTERFKGRLSDLMLRDPNSVEELTHRLRLWNSRTAAFASEAREISDELRKWSWRDMAERITELIESSAFAPVATEDASPVYRANFGHCR